MPQGKGTYGTKVGRPAKKKMALQRNVGSTSISPAGYLKAATAKKKRAAPKVKKGGGGR